MSDIITSSSPAYALIFSTVFCFWVAFELWVFSRDRKAKLKNTPNQGSGRWVILALVAGIGLGFNLPNTAPQFAIRYYPVIMFCLGLALVGAGILFRFWAIRTLGEFFRTKIIIQQEHRLITAGPYRYLRHPSYTGTLVTLIGFGLAIGNWLSLFVLLTAGLAAYAWRVRVEEQVLRERFGPAFDDYRQRTWALIPFVW